MAMDFYSGKRLSYEGNCCTVRYVGPVKGTYGDWLGVEWDDIRRGKHSGQANGVNYFTSIVPRASSFIRLNRKADEPRSFLQALRHKYAADATTILDAPIVKIGGKYVQNIGFEKVMKQQSALNHLDCVILDTLCVDSAYSTKHEETLSQINSVCPNITELHLINNLIESIQVVADICAQLPKLTLLKLNGNRFSTVDIRSIPSTITEKLVELSLDDTYMPEQHVITICQYFPKLERLSLIHNSMFNFNITEKMLPSTLTSIDLGFNKFPEINLNLEAITNLPKLQRFLLYQCQVTSIALDHPVFSQSLKEVDLSYNEIRSWAFVDDIPKVFPGLEHLIISHNPLFQDFHASDGTSVGGLIVIARLPNLKRLNHSPVSPKFRQEAELYYISLVTQELETKLNENEADIIARHPEYSRLCTLYDASPYQRFHKEFIPNSLATRLIRIHISYVDNLKSTNRVIEIPKQFSVYTMLGQIGKTLDLSPIRIKIYKETQHIQSRTDHLLSDTSWDSNDEDETEFKILGTKEIEIKPSPRSVETVFDTDDVVVIVKSE